MYFVKARYPLPIDISKLFMIFDRQLLKRRAPENLFGQEMPKKMKMLVQEVYYCTARP